MGHGLGVTSNSANLDAHRQISTATWVPIGKPSFPNPWLDVANFLPASGNTNQQGRGFRFTSLPYEVIYHIAKLMPKEAVVALALTNKAMYDIVGPRFPKSLNKRERWNLILLLERDLDLLVACQQCNRLHGFFEISRPERYPHSFFSQPDDRAIPCIRNPRASLPPGVTPALCRLLARRYIRRQPYAELLSMAIRTRVYTIPDFKFFDTTTLRIIDGSLYARQETFIAPLTSHGRLTSCSAYLCDHTIPNGAGDALVCPHVGWNQLGTILSHDRTSADSSSSIWLRLNSRFDNPFSKDRRYAKGHDHEDNHYGFCKRSPTESHGISCYNSDPIPRAVLEKALGPGIKCAMLHPQPCQKADCDIVEPKDKVNLVRACKVCLTDMCLSAQDVQGVGRVISMTSWKKLGGVYEGQLGAWYAHYENTRGIAQHLGTMPEQQDIPRNMDRGATVYAAFEKVNSVGSVGMYTPAISRRVMRLFSGEPETSINKWYTNIPGRR